MLKILQARLQQYLNHELPDVQAGFRKGRGARNRQHPVFFLSAHLRERLQLGSFAFSKTSLEHLEIHGSRDQIANICWIMEKAREFQKNICFCFIDYAKAFDRVDHNKLWKILKEMGIPDHLTGLLRNVYAGQEATIRTGHGTTDWFKSGKGVHQGCILSPIT